MTDLVERLLKPVAHERREGFYTVTTYAADPLRAEAASRISQQDAELERLRREVAAERESVADLAAETTRLTDAMIASRLAASEARENLASARAALWKIAGETYDDSSEKIARAALVKTEETGR